MEDSPEDQGSSTTRLDQQITMEDSPEEGSSITRLDQQIIMEVDTCNTGLSRHLLEVNCNVMLLVKTWCELYNSDSDSAKQNVLELILHSMGYKRGLDISGDDFKKLDLLKKECHDVFGDLGIEPLTYNEVFFLNVKTFLENTFKEAVLVNESFIKTIISLLNAMSRCKWRSARYTAATYSCIFTQCYSLLCESLNVKNLKATENTAPKIKQVLDLMDPFLLLQIVSMTDIELPVRKISLEMFWNLCVSYPAIYMKTIYLKYIYWAISDRNSSIRTMAVKMCGYLLQSNFICDQSPFKITVLPELIKRAYDLTDRVAIDTLKSLSIILKRHRHWFHIDDMKRLYPLICSGPLQSKTLAGRLLYIFISNNNSACFISRAVIFIDSSEQSLKCKCSSKVIAILIPYANTQLTDWKAWMFILLEMKLPMHLKEKACSLLICVLEECRYSKSTLTNFFILTLFQLWDTYAKHEECLKHLLKVPRYFNIELSDMNAMYRKMKKLQCKSVDCIDEFFKTLCVVFDKMESSGKWKNQGQLMKNDMINHISNSVKSFYGSDVSKCDLSQTRIIHYKALSLAKYIDVSETTLSEQSSEILKLGVSMNDYYIIKAAIHTNFFIINWRVKNILKINIVDESLNDRLKNLETCIHELFSVLRALRACVGLISIHSFAVCCKLYLLFYPNSDFVLKYPEFQRHKPSLDDIEWMNFYVHQCAEQKATSDEQLFEISQAVLLNFCALMVTQVVPLKYVHSILPFFHCPGIRNYNEILQKFVRKVVSCERFPTELISSIELYSTENNLEQTKLITEAVIKVGISNLPSSELIQKVAFDVVVKGIHYIKSKGNLSFFSILGLFLSLMAEPDVLYVKRYIKANFRL